MLKDYLGDKNVQFTEKLVDQDDASRDEMMKASGGFLGVPFTVVTKDDGAKETIIGFDKGKINQVLGLS
jgi:glutaredoxin